ncbi:MAG TPA: phenylalanine--tRNA ligase subunit alpha [Candidatus Saccharimonadales bacterium]|nr:phenylalanine--tRNA ligase subunit alpha [Candidatus Saccharimonadales bacterium]
MNFQNPQVNDTAQLLKKRFAETKDPASVLKSIELKTLFDQIKLTPAEERASFGQQVNALRQELSDLVNSDNNSEDVEGLDITAPFDINPTKVGLPTLFSSDQGTLHPLTSELNTVLDIFYRMGFTAVESREIDDEYHMFSSLNFPAEHPARDDYDTFTTTQKDKNGNNFIAPAHTSTMQNRVLRSLKDNLENGQPIAVVIPGRVFRNEDLDARHEHTFYQLEGVYVDKDINAGHLIATLKTFLQEYYSKELDVKTQPFYFPFTEPSFEFALSCPFCDKAGCNVCSYSGWIELLGCGMIHPNVLKEAGIDPEVYTGFAWGGGIERLVMMKYGIEDIRYFESARLDFLRQF